MNRTEAEQARARYIEGTEEYPGELADLARTDFPAALDMLERALSALAQFRHAVQKCPLEAKGLAEQMVWGEVIEAARKLLEE